MLDPSLINSATSNVVLQATQDINFNAPINIVTPNVGITAQAGNSIIVGNSINTTNGSVDFTVDPTFAGASTGTGNITISAPITTNGGNITMSISNAGQVAVSGNLSSGAGNISLSENGSTIAGARGINIASTSISSTTGSITLNGNVSGGGARGVNISSGASITSNSGAINITGISSGIFGNDGVRIESVLPSGTTNITTTTGNINITGNAVNSSSLGINIQAPAADLPTGNLNINSGTGNLTFTSDRSEFPSVGFGGSGTLTLQPFSNNAALVIDGSGTNVFLGNSFLTTLDPTLSIPSGAANPNSKFSSVIIGNATSNNAISLANFLSISTPISGTTPSQVAPISILTARTFNANGNDIDTNTAPLTLTANQGITNLGNISTSGGNATITSSLGNITSNSGTTITTASEGASGGNITITANNGSLSLQNLNSRTTNGGTDTNAGNITLTVAGDNNISVADVIASRISTSNGNAGNLSFAMGTGNITLTGTNIVLSANVGKGGSVVFPNPVIISALSPIVSLSINADGTTSSGSVTFNDTLTSPTGSRLGITTSTLTVR
ncbi:MAG: hypothetical protein WCP16_19620 [Pseudanabaena sp. ELA645]